MTGPAHDEASKFARYRQRKHAQGKKLLRLWVIDPNAPGFAEEVARQIAVPPRRAGAEGDPRVLRGPSNARTAGPD